MRFERKKKQRELFERLVWTFPDTLPAAELELYELSSLMRHTVDRKFRVAPQIPSGLIQLVSLFFLPNSWSESEQPSSALNALYWTQSKSS